MTDINAITTALAKTIGTTGLRYHATAPGQIAPPAAVVIPARPAIVYGQTMDGEVTVNLLAIVLLSAANDSSGQVGLNAAISTSGARSVIAAVNANPFLDNTVESVSVLQVSTYGLVEYAGQQYMGATFAIQVFARL